MTTSDHDLNQKQLAADIMYVALLEAKARIGEAMKHQCAGFYCAVCDYSGLVWLIDEALAKADGK